MFDALINPTWDDTLWQKLENLLFQVFPSRRSPYLTERVMATQCMLYALNPECEITRAEMEGKTEWMEKQTGRIIRLQEDKGLLWLQVSRLNNEIQSVYVGDALDRFRERLLGLKYVALLGQDVWGRIVPVDLSAYVHTLVVGAPLSGKDSSIKSMLYTVLEKNSPDDFHLTFLDAQLSNRDWMDFPHLPFGNSNTLSDFATQLKSLNSELASRAERIARGEVLPLWLIVLAHGEDVISSGGVLSEDYTSILKGLPDMVWDGNARLMILASTARPHLLVLDNKIFERKIIFKTNDSEESEWATGSRLWRADKLLGAGDALFADTASKVNELRLQGFHLRDTEMLSLRERIKTKD